MTPWIDRLLIVLFALACFVSLYYTPSFLLGCGWDGLKQGADGACSHDWIGRAWLGYTSVEPIYADLPLWLRMINEFDTYFFGWFYLLSLIVFLRGRQSHTGYRAVATFMSGMMAYAMIFYMSWELQTYRDTGANIQQVMIYNGMWVLIFVLLMIRLHLLEPAGLAAPKRA